MTKTAFAAPCTSPGLSVTSCGKCQSTELRRLEKQLFDKVFSLRRLHCSRCKHRQRSFHFEWTVVPKALLALLLFGAPVYFAQNPALLGNRLPATGTVSDNEPLSRARSAAGGQLSSFEQMMTRRPKVTLDNAEVLRLWRANVGAGVVLQMIRTSNGAYDVTTNGIIALKEAQVDQSIILAIIDSNYNAR